jgi:hypothetical protein
MSSPWKDYAPEPEPHERDVTFIVGTSRRSPPANRWLAILVCLAVVCAIVAVFS